MTEWKPKAGEDAVVRVRELLDDGRLASLEGSSGVLFTSALRPLPAALSAEDAAVLAQADRAEQEMSHRGTRWNEERDALLTLVRQRRARRSTPPAAVASATPRDATALRDAVVEAAKAWAFDTGNILQAERCAWSSASLAVHDAVRALLAAEAPPDPVAELREAADELLRAQDNHPLTYDKSSPHRPQAANNLHKAMDRLRAALSAIGDRGRG